MVWVTELGTNTRYEYSLPVDKAVVCAYYQFELGNFNNRTEIGHFWNKEFISTRHLFSIFEKVKQFAVVIYNN